MGSFRASAALVLLLVASACASGRRDSTDDLRWSDLDREEQIQRTIDDYKDLSARRAQVLARERRPVANSALPPRHLDVDRFPTALIDRGMIVAGGPPPDGIPAIDDPKLVPASRVDWLDDREAVLALIDGSHAHAYPIRVLMWHEIVNSEIGGNPVVVTYCPLCNSGLAFDRSVDGETLDFGTSGSLYQANLVMYDRQSESLWTQFDGRAVVGERVGTQLRVRPVSTISWSDFRDAHPDGVVLSDDTGFDRPYGRNLYSSYESRTTPLSGYFTGDSDPTMPPYERVVGVQRSGTSIAIRSAELAAADVLHTEIDGVPTVAWHADGMSSPLSSTEVAGGDVVGATGVFVAEHEGTTLRFRPGNGSTFVDDATGSTWNVLGEAIAGPLTGAALTPIHHVDTFWFSWATFRPGTDVVSPPAADD